MNTNQYLDACKKKLKVESDYALAKHLEISKSAFPKYRHKNGTLDDRIAMKVAETLGIPKGRVLADMQAERAKDEALVKIWKKLAEAATACIVVALMGTAVMPNDAYAKVDTHQIKNDPLRQENAPFARVAPQKNFAWLLHPERN